MLAVKKISDSPSEAKSPKKEKLLDKFAARKSDELIIALAGPIGCGISSVVDELVEKLRERGYVDVVHIKLSRFLEDASRQKLISDWKATPEASARLIRYRRLQEAGKDLRKRAGNPAILAEYAAKEIAIDRLKRNESSATPTDGPIIPQKIAYLIDQVKRPEEVALLRAIYRNLFYLAGVTRIYDLRVAALEQEGVRKDEVDGLMEIDRYEDGSDGQQLDKTLHLADYFIRNDTRAIAEKKKKLVRFLDLVHGDKSVTPTHAEQGMYAAYSASLRSACLSRQVGAAIATDTGEIVATGCNDVPKADGGLYSSTTGFPDMRCIHQEGQTCFNDIHKRKLQSEIGDIVDAMLTASSTTTAISLPPAERESMLDAIYKKTRLKDLIEFSRSVHAEMDAIVSTARIGGVGLRGATLYTTTFPCHSCARHIVASGIMKVFFIEPYEKSLAKELHSDSIAFEIEETLEGKQKRVEFLHFEGASPRQFNNMFRAAGRKDANGKFQAIRIQEADKVVPEYLDAYQDFEAKAVEHLVEEVKRLEAAALDKAAGVTETPELLG